MREGRGGLPPSLPPLSLPETPRTWLPTHAPPGIHWRPDIQGRARPHRGTCRTEGRARVTMDDLRLSLVPRLALVLSEEWAGRSQPSQSDGPRRTGVRSCVTAPRAGRPAGLALGGPQPGTRPHLQPTPSPSPRPAASLFSPPPPLSGAFSPLSAAVALGLIISNLLFEDRCPCLIKTSNFESKLGLNFL